MRYSHIERVLATAGYRTVIGAVMCSRSSTSGCATVAVQPERPPWPVPSAWQRLLVQGLLSLSSPLPPLPLCAVLFFSMASIHPSIRPSIRPSSEHCSLGRVDDVQGLRAASPEGHQAEGGCQDGSQPPHHHAGDRMVQPLPEMTALQTLRWERPCRFPLPATSKCSDMYPARI